MIAKELRDGWWKFAVGALLILLPALALMSYKEAEEQANNQGLVYNTVTLDGNSAEPQAPPPPPPPALEGLEKPMGTTEYALSQVWVSYGIGGGWVMMFLAAILGFSLVSGEVSRGSILLLLSRPVGRNRILLTKYGVEAGILLAVVTLGALGLVVSAGLKGYPIDALSVTGVVLSAALLWLGSLSVLGLATLASVAFRDVIVSAIATPLVLILVFLGPSLGVGYLFKLRSVEMSGQLSEKLLLPLYWGSENLFVGKSLAATNFLVCLVSAAVPLLVALWLFNRKAY